MAIKKIVTLDIALITTIYFEMVQHFIVEYYMMNTI